MRIANLVSKDYQAPHTSLYPVATLLYHPYVFIHNVKWEHALGAISVFLLVEIWALMNLSDLSRIEIEIAPMIIQIGFTVIIDAYARCATKLMSITHTLHAIIMILV